MADLKVIQEVECRECLTEVEFTLDDQRSTNGVSVTYVAVCPNPECGYEVEWVDEGDG